MLEKKTIDKLRAYFSKQPINKVWLFGSYARSEEDSNSDIDLLVAFDKNSKVSLHYGGNIYGLASASR